MLYKFIHLHTKTIPKGVTTKFSAVLAKAINLRLSEMVDTYSTIPYILLV